MGFMKAFEGQIYAALRIVAGLTLLCFGLVKLFDFPFHMDTENWIRYSAGPIELVGGTLVMLGFLTRPAAFILSGHMAAAYFIGHVKAQGGFLPIQNGGTLAALYSFVFLFVSARGAGKWSVDR